MVYVYMIKDLKGQLYTGISNNPTQRLKRHNSGRGALLTSQSENFKIVFLEAYSNLEEARVREIQIKKWRREKKEMLIERYIKGLPTYSSIK